MKIDEPSNPSIHRPWRATGKSARGWTTVGFPSFPGRWCWLWLMNGYGCFLKWGHPNSWMVLVRENPDLKWMITRGEPYFRKLPYRWINNNQDLTQTSCILLGWNSILVCLKIMGNHQSPLLSLSLSRSFSLSLSLHCHQVSLPELCRRESNCLLSFSQWTWPRSHTHVSTFASCTPKIHCLHQSSSSAILTFLATRWGHWMIAKLFSFLDEFFCFLRGKWEL